MLARVAVKNARAAKDKRFHGEWPPIFAKQVNRRSRMTFIDGMKVRRPTMTKASIRWWALGCLLIWLAGLSANAAQCGSSCGDKSTRNACAKLESACCCQDGSDLPGEPLSAPPVLTPQDLPTALSVLVRVAVCLNDSAPPLTLRDRSGGLQIPPELRLGSALWSHAPPTHAS